MLECAARRRGGQHPREISQSVSPADPEQGRAPLVGVKRGAVTCAGRDTPVNGKDKIMVLRNTKFDLVFGAEGRRMGAGRGHRGLHTLSVTQGTAGSDAAVFFNQRLRLLHKAYRTEKGIKIEITRNSVVQKQPLFTCWDILFRFQEVGTV